MPFFIVLTFFAALQAQEFKPVQDSDEESVAEMLNEVPAKKIKTAEAPTESVVEIPEKQEGQTVSGVVRLIRSSPQTEIFFKDLKQSYIIPKTSQHNKIYEACLQSSKTGKAVALQVDPVSRRVLAISNQTASGSDPKSGLGPASNSESQKGNK